MDNRTLYYFLSFSIFVQVGGFYFLSEKYADSKVNSGTGKHLSSAANSSPSFQSPNLIVKQDVKNSPALPPAFQHTLQKDLRQIIREELQNITKQTEITTPSATNKRQEASAVTEQPITPNAYASETASSEVRTIVNNALSSGIWTQDSNLAILKYSKDLAPKARIELTEELYGAINRQELKINDAFPTL